MAAMESDDIYYSLAPVGFPEWEHTRADKWANGRTTMFIRRCGDLIPHLIKLERGGDMLDAVSAFVAQIDRRCDLPENYFEAA